MKSMNRKALDEEPRNNPVPITLDPATIDGLVDATNYPGLITRDKADAPFLEVQIPTSTWIPVPTNPARQDVLDIYLDDKGNFETGHVSSETVFFPGAVPGSYSVRIPQRLLTEGAHHFSYRITNGGAVGSEAGSPQVPLIIDRTAPYDSYPYDPPRLTLPAGWPGTITEAYLASFDAAGGIPFGIPDYTSEGADTGDQCEMFYEGSSQVIAKGPVFPDRVVRFTRALAEVADGPRKLKYRLVDVAGNVSALSFELPITVSLAPAPTLGAAGVRDALSLAGAGDRLIDRADTAKSSGIFLIIPTYDADRSADEFFAHLTTIHGTRDLGPFPLGGSPLPYDFHVAYANLAALYGTSIGPINLAVEYSVRRHGALYRVPTASNIELDLAEGGPDYPEKPDPVNTNLLRPVLTGAGSGKTNELDEDDKGLDADVSVELWPTLPPPSAQDFIIHLKYMNDTVDSKAVSAATASPGDKIPMKVSWPYIQRHSNNMIPLSYEIEIAGTHNRALSPSQLIDVKANVISFLKPTVEGALAEIDKPPAPVVPGEIRCGALLAPLRQARVQIPPHPLLEQGMIITVNWAGCSDDDGTVQIPETVDTFPYGPITFAEAQLGFTVPVGPYDTYIKPINRDSHSRGSVVISYTVPIINASPVSSAEAILLVRGVVTGPAYCDASPWPGTP